MRLPHIVATVLVLALVACNGPTEPTPAVEPESTATETPEYAGAVISIDEDSVYDHLFREDPTGFWEPSSDDVSKAEACAKRFLVAAPDDPELGPYYRESAAFILEHLEEYRGQYAGIVVDGEKRVWLNAFRSDDPFPHWKRDPVFVLDGGKDFWQIEYVLPRDECTNFYVHGEA
jgi:hypothetical protein